ncbi:hypothetical protein CRYUN_Cryun02cG0183900 [Craigia yunnanensis]
MARFWSKFIDEKILTTTRKVCFATGKEQEQAIEEITEQLKLLENELKGKEYFSGHSIGYLDIVANVLIFQHFAITPTIALDMSLSLKGTKQIQDRNQIKLNQS